MIIEEKEKKIELKGIVKYVYKKMGKAIADYRMIEEGDKILVGVSGGVDSLSLIKLFKMRQRRVPIRFDFMACFVSTNFIEVDKKTVINYLEDNSIPYVVREMDLDDRSIDCFWCSWNRRKVLFTTTKELFFNKLALGHNLDDITETIIMNLFFHGEISAMKPKIELFDNELTLIRPLCYVSKKDIHSFANKLNLPYTHYECKYGKDSRRQLVKNVIELVEKEYPLVKKNIFKGLRKIKKDYLL
ncbi:MAG: hypothetical protein NC822_05975 [Candidatus Omnitrophica bacterium]|nr:hypothetical protein [Candidatus Omnitrophota bacterium]MCM8827177.1 hypothetical protein [Candidatus Omnitrophota bacterium]